jgi:hypothetical protein
MDSIRHCVTPFIVRFASDEAILEPNGVIDNLVAKSVDFAAASDEVSVAAQLILHVFLCSSASVRSQVHAAISDMKRRKKSRCRLDFCDFLLDQVQLLNETSDQSNRTSEGLGATNISGRSSNSFHSPRLDAFGVNSMVSPIIPTPQSEEDIHGSQVMQTQEEEQVKTRAEANFFRSATGEMVFPVKTLSGLANQAGYTDGPWLESAFDTPTDLVLSENDQKLYVAEAGNQRIRCLDLNEGTVSTLAGSGVHGHVDGNRTVARFAFPHGLALIEPEGEMPFLCVADTGGHTIRRVDLHDGSVSTLMGQFLRAGHQTGAFDGALLSEPRGICKASDGKGNFYLSDRTGIYFADSRRRMLTLLAGGLEKGYRDGMMSEARFSAPDGLALLGGRTLFVADTYNHVIRSVDLHQGVVQTFAGCGVAGHADGELSSARFKFPQKLTLESSRGCLYVTELNDCIRCISLVERSVTTVAGTVGVPSEVDGIGVEAQFSFPYGLTVNSNGTKVFVADTDGQTIRQMEVRLPTAAILQETSPGNTEFLALEAESRNEAAEATAYPQFSPKPSLPILEEEVEVEMEVAREVDAREQGTPKAARPVQDSGGSRERKGDDNDDKQPRMALKSQMGESADSSAEAKKSPPTGGNSNSPIVTIDLLNTTASSSSEILPPSVPSNMSLSVLPNRVRVMSSDATSFVVSQRSSLDEESAPEAESTASLMIPPHNSEGTGKDEHTNTTSLPNPPVHGEESSVTKVPGDNKPYLNGGGKARSAQPVGNLSISMAKTVENGGRTTYSAQYQANLDRLIQQSHAILEEVTPLVLRTLRQRGHASPLLMRVLEVICIIAGMDPPATWTEGRQLLQWSGLRSSLKNANPDTLPDLACVTLHSEVTKLEMLKTSNIPWADALLLRWTIAFEKAAYFQYSRKLLYTPNRGHSAQRRRSSQHSNSNSAASPRRPSSAATNDHGSKGGQGELSQVRKENMKLQKQNELLQMRVEELETQNEMLLSHLEAIMLPLDSS